MRVLIIVFLCTTLSRAFRRPRDASSLVPPPRSSTRLGSVQLDDRKTETELHVLADVDAEDKPAAQVIPPRNITRVPQIKQLPRLTLVPRTLPLLESQIASPSFFPHGHKLHSTSTFAFAYRNTVQASSGVACLLTADKNIRVVGFPMEVMTFLERLIV